MATIAIIGAGLSGLALAQQLCHRADVTVFEKSRGCGGRMATRRTETYQFDHGAQFFTARSDSFRQCLKHAAQDTIALWEPKVMTLESGRKMFKREWFEPHYTANPGMNNLCKALARDCRINLECEVRDIQRNRARWELIDVQGDSLGVYDWVVTSMPAPQAIPILPDCFIHKEQLGTVSFTPCFSLMLGYQSPPALIFEAAVVRNSPIAWIAVNSSKASRPTDFSLVVHSDNEWARAHLVADTEPVTAILLDALQMVVKEDLSHPDFITLHRWRYAKAETSIQTDYLLDETKQLAACGDWCHGNRVEDAFLSGFKLGNAINAMLD